jgi:hypothetical protein
MPRNARFTLPDRPTVYHVISRTALPGFPLGDIETAGKKQGQTNYSFLLDSPKPAIITFASVHNFNL